MQIQEIHNPNVKKPKIFKENMQIFVPDIPSFLPRRNGGIIALCAPPGSGKTMLLMNLFSDKNLMKGKYHNVYFITPMSSFMSLDKHPFAKHQRVFHELNVELLETINGELQSIKEEADEGDEVQYSCVIIDDYANDLKNKDIQKALNRLLVKSRHTRCTFIFTLQSFLYMPKQLRKLITYGIFFKPKNRQEFEIIASELFNMKKDDALTLFNYAFDEPYAHLDLDTTEGKCYKNFHELILTNDK